MTEQKKQWYEETPDQFTNGFTEEVIITNNRKLAGNPFTASQLEAHLSAMLRNLPLSLTITRRSDNRYVWQFLEAGGEAGSFLAALEAALIHIEATYIEPNT